jgi:hypothetical protein
MKSHPKEYPMPYIKLTDRVKAHRGHILHQIRYTEGRKLGEYGGWVEDIFSVAQDPKVHINENVHVYDNSCEQGGAHIITDNECNIQGSVVDGACINGESITIEGSHIGNFVSTYSLHGLLIKDSRLYGRIELHGTNLSIENVTLYGDVRIGKDALITCSRDVIDVGSLGSRNDHTTFYLTKDGEIMVCCGCFTGTMSKFVKQVEETHGSGMFAQEYLAVADTVERILKARKENKYEPH